MSENNIQDNKKESLTDLEKKLKSKITLELKEELKSIKKNSSNKLSYLAIFIAALSIITLGVVLYYGYQYIISSQKKQDQIVKVYDKYETKLDKIDSNYAKITENLNNLTIKEQNDFDKLFNLTQQEQSTAIISQAENILNIIANQLINKSNLDSSFNLLKQLNEQLKYYNTPKVNLLKAGIKKDLENIEKSDYFQTLLKIENISTLPSLVDNLVAKRDQYKQLRPDNKNTQTQELKWYNRIINDIAYNFKKLFVVYRFNDASSILISPEQTFYIRENIKLSLQNLIRDYYNSNEKSFHNHLQYIKENLDKYFKNDKQFQQIYLVLNELEKINISSDLLSLLHNSISSLDEIKKINTHSSLIGVDSNTNQNNQDSATNENNSNDDSSKQIPQDTNAGGK